MQAIPMSKNRKIRDTSDSKSSPARRREVIGVLALGAALFLLVAMVSLQAGRLVMGPFGRSTAGMFYGLAGMCGYVLIAIAVAAAVRTLIDRHPAMPTTVQRQYASSIAGEVPPDQTLPELWVMDDHQLERARALLHELRNPQPRRWVCAGCGELVEGPFEQCWNCGAAMPR